MPRAPVAFPALAAVALTVVACAPSREGVQRTYARFLTPATVRAATPSPMPEARPLQVRAWVDAGHRAHATDWRERIVAQIARANAVLAGEFGVRLELESIRDWPREGDSRELAVALDALSALDPGRDVDWVLGFVEPGPDDDEPSEPEQIGIASLFGSHVVLRAMQSSSERAKFDEWYDALPEDERGALARERRVHLETGVLLHEWGHTLGAVHECDDKWIMRGGYSLLYSAYSPESARLIRLGLEHRRGSTAEAAERWASAWRAEARRMQGAAWECEKLERGLADADRVLTRRIAGRRQAEAAPRAAPAP